MENGVKIRVCPICGVKITRGKAAMKAHLDKHRGVAKVAGASAPKSRPRMQRRRPGAPLGGSGGRSVSGTDALTVVTVNAPGVLGQTLASVRFAPRSFVGTRLCQESKLFSRWRPTRLVLRVVPSAGTFVTGTYMAAWVSDPDERMPSGSEAVVRKLSTWPVHAQQHVSAKCQLNIPCDPSRRWYDLEASAASTDSTHGMAVIILTAPIANLTGQVSFTVHLDWSCLFDSPDIEAAEDPAGGAIYCDVGYENYFTDSSSDWKGGKYLTLKHKQGGYIVPFSTAKPGVIYKCSVPVLYYSSSSRTDACNYGVVATDYPAYQIMALFTSKSKATTFITSTDVTTRDAALTAYYAAGPYISPPNPSWIPEADSLEAALPLPLVSLGAARSVESPLLAEIRRLASRVEMLEIALDASRASSPVVIQDDDAPGHAQAGSGN